MKNSKYLVLVIVLFSTSVFGLNNDSHDKMNEMKSNTTLTISQVTSDILSIGGIAISTPSGWIPPAGVSGYSSVQHFDVNGHLYSVFCWDNSSDPSFIQATSDCDHKWHNNGDCKDSGSECSVSVENGETIVTCCGDES